MQTSGKINWQSPTTQQIIKELQENLLLLGRDSRVVRGACAYSRFKKQFFFKIRQQLLRFSHKSVVQTGPLKICFYLAGGLGDAVCASRVVRAYQTLLPGTVFDVYCPLPKVAQLLFGPVNAVRCLQKWPIYFQEYDLVIFACLGVKFLFANERRLQEQAPDFWPVFQQAQQAQQSLGMLLEDPFLTEGALGRLISRLGGNRFDLLQYTSGVVDMVPYVPDFSTENLKELVGKKYITFHDGTSLAQPFLPSPTRAWPHWREFIRAFRQNYPDYLVVQLGAEQSPVYPEADVCLVQKTSLQDLPGLLKGARLHIDTESGIVHLATLLQVPCVVLFGPSDKKMLGYGRNCNLSAGDCGGCMWMTTDWMARCPLGKEPAPCMASISVEQVLQGVKEMLAR